METVEGQAENFFKEGLYDKAIEKYSQLIVAKPSWLAFNNRACCYMYLTMWQESEKDFTESIKLLKNSQPPQEDQYYKSLYRRAQIYERLSKFDEAINDLHKVISFGKNFNLRSEAQDMFARIKSNSSREYDEALLISEREEFVNIFRENMAIHPGSEWHVVSNAWFQNWQAYVSLTVRDGNEDLPFNFNIEGKVEHPGTINNKDIIDHDATNATISENPTSTTKVCLKPELIENVNYVVLPREAFKFLEGIYRCSTDIKRYAIEVNDSIYQVEIFLKRVKIAFPSLMALDMGYINMSRKETVANLKKNYLSYRGSSIPARVWKVNLGSISLERLQAIAVSNSKVYIEGGIQLKEDIQLDDAEIGDEDIIVIEPARNGSFLFSDDPTIAVDKCVFCQKSGSSNITCAQCKKVKYCTVICKRKHAEEHKTKCKQPKKLSIFRCICRHSDKLENYDEDEVVVSAQRQTIRSKNTATGLQNLGNTCFMNSALQCLSHTEELTRYFISNEYSKEINKSNPLGTKGKLAIAYAELLENLWKSGALSFAPWKFKKTLASFAPQFVGYHQHDAHELLCYLLDGLHEDLNKVKKKPYFEDVDDKGKSDEILSRESWDRHVARNQSIVVDLMHGQYKSTLFCPTCKNYSHTFDPFNIISLPIPQSQERKLLFYLIKSNPNESPLRMGCDVSNDSPLSIVRQTVAKLMKIPQNSFLFISIVNDVVREILDDDRKIDTLKSITLFAFQEEDCTIKIPIEIQVSKERHKNKYIAFPRIVFIHRSNTFKMLHLEAFKKVKIYIDKYREIPPKGAQASYEKFIQNPAYRLFFTVKKDSVCPLCREASCTGCQVPYSTDLIESMHAKGRIIIELRWREDCAEMGANLQDINRCSEHSSASEERATARPPISINECFHMFRVPEELEKENSWFCPTCRTHVQATKQLEIYKVPPILVIHLKRFKTHGYYREKLSTVVTFPEQGLDISGFVIGPEKPPLYDLYAVSNHFGNLGGGHYTATCFDIEQNKWLEFNDSKVTEATEIGVASSYLLFYKARP